ncbi:hypothetical protein [Chryseobacterium luquanense]|uniref:Knr4/Smi1-like domain-containing protein n=1 Tax=Chryseobacterium luquanense TaxID=2983766 RepID=A0ABT3Y0Z3_9FLAO|nr:hypothetical protein [Chryseobacterium luquanense]MCX8531802.1 hypothetical protein [Chryseobacterium luquanense]
MIVPEDFTEFLYWIKERTERLWSVDDENHYPKGFYGAQWQPLSEEQIDAVELKYAVKFTSEHREFLRVLHAVDKKEIIEYEDDGEIITEHCTFFYNWLEDEEEILKIMKEPYQWMFDDIDSVNKVWLKSWGIKPKSEAKRKEIFDEWFSHIPKLLPLTGTRFMISDENLSWKPILSVRGSDIVTMGWDFRTYLLNELKNHLDIHIWVFDEEDQMFYPELLPEVQEIFDQNFKYDETKDIPYLKEMMLYWSSGWSSFDMNYHPENAKIRPIVKTYIAEEEI